MLNTPYYEDTKRKLFVPGNTETTLKTCVDHFIQTAKISIQEKGAFFVALSGGSTPKAVFEKLPTFLNALDWSKVYLFWSDERSVPGDHPDSNYHMAMKAGFEKLPIPKNQIFRMKAEESIEENAKDYEKQIRKTLGKHPFDLILLGMGEDGHTASLFPGTEALKIQDRWIAANFVAQKNTWRMTMTYPCLENSKQTVFYVLGDSKKEMLHRIFFDPSLELPCQKVGGTKAKSIWIADDKAVVLFPKKS